MFNTSINDLKKQNSLKRPKLFVGQKLRIPGTKQGVYIVKRGDHLTKLSREFNTSMEALIKINNLDQKKIYPGQKIIVNMD
jgi:LysM repeat protein